MSALLDPEVVELLADEPELLALADALGSTRAPRRRPAAWIASGAAAVAAAILVALLAPWNGGGSPTLARALAALGDRPVIHVIARVQFLRASRHPAEFQIETWYDTKHRLLHTITRANGRIVGDVLVSRSVRVGRSGIIPFARVATPTLDPALADFTTRYREALASGTAHVVRTERDRIWIDFPRPGLTREVAVDRKTYKPLLLRTLVRGKRVGPDEQIIVAETLPLGAGNFKAPRKGIVRRP